MVVGQIGSIRGRGIDHNRVMSTRTERHYVNLNSACLCRIRPFCNRDLVVRSQFHSVRRWRERSRRPIIRDRIRFWPVCLTVCHQDDDLLSFVFMRQWQRARSGIIQYDIEASSQTARDVSATTIKSIIQVIDATQRVGLVKI